MISPEILRRYPHFAKVPEDCLKSVAAISVEASFKAGDHLFDESGSLKASAQIYEKGDPASHLMLLTEGEVDVAYTFAEGEQIVVGTLVAGDLMAISAVIPPYHLTATGIAKKDGKVIQIEAEEMRRLCEEVPELGYRIMLQIAKTAMARLTETRVQLAAQS